MRYVQERRRLYPGRYLLYLLVLLLTALAGALCAIYFLLETSIFSQRLTRVVPQERGISMVDWQSELSTISTVADHLAPTVVYISNVGKGSDFLFGNSDIIQGSGSGVIFAKEGYIITNSHVISGAEKIFVHLADGRQCEATLLGNDKRSDLALLRIDLPDLQVAPLGDSDTVVVGELALAIGNPGGERFARSLTMGVISGLNRLVETSEGSQFKLIQTDAAINPGNSGGPLVNGRGEVIGINSVKIADANFEGMGFAIPINTVRRVMDDLLKYGTVIRPALQVVIWGELSPELAAYNNLTIDYGVVVIPQADGVAAQAGLRQYDIIIALDGRKVASAAELQEIMFEKAVGDTIEVTAMRGSSKIVVNVKLAQLGQ